MSHTCPRPFSNQITLELSDCSHNVEKKLTGRGSPVDSFGVADKIDPKRTEFIEAFDQVLQRAGEALEFPDQNP